MTAIQKGACFCGAVQIEVSGDPVAMGYCHCGDCRSWSAGPVNAFTLFPKDAVRVTKGQDKIGHFMKTDRCDRQFCTACGGHLMTWHPQMNLMDVYAATIPTLAFAPGLHVHYGESVLSIKDGLPKMKDLPAEMGGSGVLLPE